MNPYDPYQHTPLPFCSRWWHSGIAVGYYSDYA